MPGTLGHDTVLLRDSTVVGGIESLEPPQLSRDSVETTPHATEDRYRTFIPGLRDGGEVSLEVMYDPSDASHEGLLDDFNDNVVHEYSVRFPASIGKTWTFDAFLTALGEETPKDDKVVRAVTFKVSGKPVLADTPVS